MIRLFGIVFGGAAVRKNVLHADPVGRRITFKSKIETRGAPNCPPDDGHISLFERPSRISRLIDLGIPGGGNHVDQNVTIVGERRVCVLVSF